MLKTRIATALVLLLCLGAVLFYPSPVAAVVTFSIIAALAAWEWGGLMGQQRSARILFAAVVLLFCWQLSVGIPQFVPVLLMVSTVFWIAVMPFWLRYKWRLSGNDALGYVLGGLIILPTWAAMVALQAISPWMLLAAMGTVWVADVAAYFTGRAFGKHKLAPTISPGKTWEGVAGAVVGVLIYGGVLFSYSPLASQSAISVPMLGLMLLLLTAVSVIGDLFESLLKRQAGIKDSSNLLPGHGGVLDRIDSLTSTLPLTALILHLVRL